MSSRTITATWCRSHSQPRECDRAVGGSLKRSCASTVQAPGAGVSASESRPSARLNVRVRCAWSGEIPHPLATARGCLLAVDDARALRIRIVDLKRFGGNHLAFEQRTSSNRLEPSLPRASPGVRGLVQRSRKCSGLARPDRRVAGPRCAGGGAGPRPADSASAAAARTTRSSAASSPPTSSLKWAVAAGRACCGKRRSLEHHLRAPSGASPIALRPFQIMWRREGRAP